MSERTARSALAPFRIPSYRFQWPADLCASWGFEMEAIILGWYVLVETKSVLLLSVFASLQYFGTLLAPMSGVVGHRIGNKRLACMMRAAYAVLGTTLMTLGLTGALTPVHVFVLASTMGLMRPSDLVMRNALIGTTMPRDQLLQATSVSRTTQDSARIMGSLTGAGLAAALGTGLAYTVVASLYTASFVLTLFVTERRVREPGAAGAVSSPGRDLWNVIAYVRRTPHLLAAMSVAFLVNLTAFPLITGLMPYVAREIYRTNQAGLGYLIASFASGALAGSIALSRYGHLIRPGRMIIVFCAVWYGTNLVFAHMPTLSGGMAVLVLSGLAQSLCLVPVTAMLLRTSDERFRGGVMGVRQLMIYGVPIGLMTASPLITRFGYPATATLYGLIGLALTAVIAFRWRAHMWSADAPANAR